MWKCRITRIIYNHEFQIFFAYISNTNSCRCRWRTRARGRGCPTKKMVVRRTPNPSSQSVMTGERPLLTEVATSEKHTEEFYSKTAKPRPAPTASAGLPAAPSRRGRLVDRNAPFHQSNGQWNITRFFSRAAPHSRWRINTLCNQLSAGVRFSIEAR